MRKQILFSILILTMALPLLSFKFSDKYLSVTHPEKTALVVASKATGGNNENELYEKLIEYTSRTIYTIQAGSFIEISRARTRFKSIKMGLSKEYLGFLRIEKIGEYYAVRLGSFEDYTVAKKFLQAIKHQLGDAIILKAHIKEENIIRLYEKLI